MLCSLLRRRQNAECKPHKTTWLDSESARSKAQVITSTAYVFFVLFSCDFFAKFGKIFFLFCSKAGSANDSGDSFKSRHTTSSSGSFIHSNGLDHSVTTIDRFQGIEDFLAGLDVHTVEYVDGAVYQGEYRDAQKHGLGIIQYPSGDVYKGSFRHDQFEGNGTYITHEMTYRGQWRNGVCHGKGTEIWADGSKFEGTFDMGEKAGYGVFVWQNGNSFRGYWQQNQMHGKGRLQYASGDVYQGEFSHGSPDGQGKLVRADGQVFEGLFREGEPSEACRRYRLKARAAGM